jgi:hypothetical protein
MVESVAPASRRSGPCRNRRSPARRGSAHSIGTARRHERRSTCGALARDLTERPPRRRTRQTVARREARRRIRKCRRLRACAPVRLARARWHKNRTFEQFQYSYLAGRAVPFLGADPRPDSRGQAPPASRSCVSPADSASFEGRPSMAARRRPWQKSAGIGYSHGSSLSLFDSVLLRVNPRVAGGRLQRIGT